jgi:hypothetical protein
MFCSNRTLVRMGSTQHKYIEIGDKGPPLLMVKREAYLRINFLHHLWHINFHTHDRPDDGNSQPGHDHQQD